MKEIIEMVLKEEEEARIRIEKAKSEADAIIAKAGKDAALIIENTIAQVNELAARKKEESQKKIIADRDNTLNATQEQSAVLRKARQKDIPEISRAIFLRIIDIEG
jgi:vacuolar-type H+-ATPase subunit H